MNLLVIKTLKSGEVVRTLLNYSSDNEATSALFYELWYASADENVTKIVAEIISDNGNVTKCERWEGHNTVVDAEIQQNIDENLAD